MPKMIFVNLPVTDVARSTAFYEAIGMTRDPASDFDHPRVPDETPHLKRHTVYRIQAD